MKDLDKHLTTPFDNGYDKWADEVWEIISKAFSIPKDEMDDYWDNFFEPLTLQLSTSGTLPSGGCEPYFAAKVITGKWKSLKRDYRFLLPILKTAE